MHAMAIFFWAAFGVAATFIHAQGGDAILATTGIKSGLAVHVGSGDGSTTVGLHNGGRILVVGLETDKTKIGAARKLAHSQGLYGIVSFDFAPSLNTLPFKANLVSLLVVDADALGAQAPEQTEMLRVVHPEGVVYAKKGGSWTKSVKPFPAEYDSWPFWDHGPDGNANSEDKAVDIPRGFQWMGGWDFNNTQSGWQRIWRQYLSTEERLSKNGSSRTMVRNSFNGLPIWSRNAFQKVSPHFIYDNKVFMLHSSAKDKSQPMVAYDIATGDTVATFAQGAQVLGSEWGISNGSGFAMTATAGAGLLIQAGGAKVYASDARTGALKWSADAQAAYIGNPVLDTVGKRVFAIEFDAAPILYRWPSFSKAKSISAFDLVTGALKWRTPSTANNLSQLVYYKGKLAAITSVAIGGVNHDKEAGSERKTALLDADNGKVLWTRPFTDAAYNGMFRNDTLYVPGSSILRGYDIATGDTSMWKSQNQGCMRVVTTPRHIQFGHLGFLDGVNSGNWTYNYLQRPSCATGIFPANGMWYGAANPRCNCVAMYRTHQVWDCAPPAAPVIDGKRLTPGSQLPGPETGAAPAGTPVKSVIRDEWNFGVYGPLGTDGGNPAFRMDKELPPVSAGGIDYVVIPHEHRLEARKGGAAIWSYIAGGRIIAQPLAYGDKVYLGSRDGYVYCLKASDGAPQWRFLAAADERRIVINCQVESVWPVGNVVAYNNTIAFSAGLTVEADGGSHFYGLDPESGAIKWKFRLFTPNLTGGKGTRPTGVPKLKHPNVLTHLLESSGDALSMKWVAEGRSGVTPITRGLAPAEWNGKTIDIVTSTVSTITWRDEETFTKAHGKVILGDGWFEVPEAGQVKVSRVSITGRILDVIYQGQSPKGRTFLKSGSASPAGPYILRLDWSGGAVLKKQIAP